MPQQTNLNVAPYFDDFDTEDDYHKVLFKPAYPVQARELNNLQSILQNQIERFGQHFFKEGARVIPGNIGYTQNYTGVQLNNNFKGVPVSAYIDQLIGAKITGSSSGVTAVVGEILLAEDSERDNLTLYCQYISSSTVDNNTVTFSDGEELISNVDISSGLLGNSIITAGSPFAFTLATGASIVGSSFQIEDGIYFVRGQFLPVSKEVLILDQYNTNPSYRIGLYVDEQIITSDQDESLTDNSQGFNNYAAPGADRLKISLSLFKKNLTDLDDANFVELASVVDGNLQEIIRKGFGEGSFDFDVVDTLARRTYDESGDYYVKPFNIQVKNSLNNNIGNGGIFQSDQFTYGGSIPSDGLALYKISPGKAYVKGYEVETKGTTWIDANKPRTTKLLEDHSIIYNTGLTFNLNRTHRSPTIGIGNTYYVSLRDERVGEDQEVAPGNEIGVARVYDYKLESGSYDRSNGNSNVWGISLYDVQNFTNITLNQSHTLSVPCYIEGQNSGAKGFLRSAVSAGTAVTVYDVSGEFVKGEELSFNGIPNGRVAAAVTSAPVSDVRSLYATNDGTTGINTFSADVVQYSTPQGDWGRHHQTNNVGFVSITAASGSPSISTVRMAVYYPNLYSSLFTHLDDGTWKPNLKVGDLVQYSDSTLPSEDPSIAKVVSVSTGVNFVDNYVNIAGVTTVTGVCEGALPSTLINIGYGENFSILSTNLDSSSDNSLYTLLPKPNVSNIDLDDSSITIRKVYSVDISSNEISSSSKPTAGDNESFLPFDEERYSLIRTDGTTEVLTRDKLSFNPTATVLSIGDLGSNDVGATLVATLSKAKPTSKKKIKNRVNSIVINKSQEAKSGIGSTNVDDGLEYGNYPWGTRVQDNTISLNVPDVIKIHGIYESTDNYDPSAPKVTLTSIISASNTTEEVIIGEQLIGQSSGTVAICVEKIDSSNIAFIRKNDFQFEEGETVIFQESSVTAIVSTIDAPSFSINNSYTFNSGQKASFYNYGTITRKEEFSAPSRRIKIYFENGYYDPTDTGDITTVNSYDTYNYTSEIQSINGVRNTDTIDIRPRTNSLSSISQGSRSPLEFFGREFNAAGNSATNILASNENILLDFSYYLGRKDRLFLTNNGRFQLVYGNPSDNLETPNPVDDSIEIATITLPPYLYSPKEASIKFLEHKRYRMKDIKNLENRIKNLEYYTALSILEVGTANMFIADNNGLNRFKSGFFVDNFNSFIYQDNTVVKNSIDRKNHVSRPTHYTTEVNLMHGPVVNVDSTVDSAFTPIEGTNVRKSRGGAVTLDYADRAWITQPFATRTESVTPYLVNFWKGTVELTPASDTWIDVQRDEAQIIEVEGDFTETLMYHVENSNVDAQTGFAPAIWNAWETDWTGSTVRDGGTRTRVESQWVGGGIRTRTYLEVMEERIDTGVDTRTGTQIVITEDYEDVSIGDREVSRTLLPLMRSRNVQFDATSMKPNTRVYGFFDGIDVSQYCVPKLLEISMTNGTFAVGETVFGRMDMDEPSEQHVPRCPEIHFRVCQSNHKSGPYNIPDTFYTDSPYAPQIIPSVYTSNSTILNVDTLSLAEEAQGDYWGWVDENMILVGQESGATAIVTNLRLVTDHAATLKGSFYIPDPECINHPEFESGEKTFTLINNTPLDKGSSSTYAEEGFTSSGTIQTVQEQIISIRNATVDNRAVSEARDAERTTGMVAVQSEMTSESWWFPPPPPPPPAPRRWSDPIAQSFLVGENTGVFVTQCDVFFKSKDDMDMPVTCQIRTMSNGFPTEKILPFSEVVLSPDEVITSDDGEDATTFVFGAPVYLEHDIEYSICLVSDSAKYSVFIARVGENDITTQSFISDQPLLGSLFKSQNGSTWNASQWEDLKFTLYRADFLSSGAVDYYSPQLSESLVNQVAKLSPNSLTPISRKIRVGLGTTVADSGYEIGNTFFQQTTNATGNLVGTAGTAVGDLEITNSGIGYTPNSGTYVFDGVTLNTVTGHGRGATGDITIQDGVAIAATISNAGGSGYQIGDVLGITDIGNASIGRNMRLSVAGIGNTSEIILENVQGEFVIAGAAKTVMYINSLGVTTALNGENDLGGDVQISSIIVDSDGTHIKVNHKNHGMYSDKNIVKLFDVKSDTNPTKLAVDYNTDSVSQISVVDATIFRNFENVGVGTTNVGFLRIGDEIIEYTNVTGNLIGGNIVRGSNKFNYKAGTPVHKYELDGVNLKRINGIHSLSDATVSDPIGFDYYHIKVDMSTKFNVDNDDRSTDIGYPKLYLKDTKSAGGFSIRATQNIPFEVLTPIVQNVTVNGTSLSGEVRTITGSSISGNEIPFVDAGFEPISLDSPTYFDTPRMIASKVNEDKNLDSLPGNKSMHMRLYLGSTDTRVSPIIDSQRIGTILTSNRVNDVVTNYATDKRVKSIINDPTACQYISKQILLENSATSLKIIVDAHINVDSDIRAFYAIGDGSGFTPIFTPFPGYDNLDSRGQIIAKEDCNGKSDVLVTKSNLLAFRPENIDFKEYTFTIDKLPSFRSYQIKISLISKDQCYVPQMKDLRVIALA